MIKYIIGFIFICLSFFTYANTLSVAEAHYNKKEYIKAFNIYNTLAKKNDAIAQLNVGVFYQNGLGVQKDLKKAFDWTEQAAWNGNVEAIHNLALFYNYGIGTQVNMENALYYYEMASELGNPKSQLNFGILNITNQFIPQDIIKAYMWTYLASEAKLKEADVELKKMNKILTKGQISEAKLRAGSWKIKKFNLSTAPKEIKQKLKTLK